MATTGTMNQLGCLPLQVIVLLLALATVVAPVAAQDAASEDLVLVAASAAAGAECSPCATVGPVCAELPNAPGIKQTVMSRCIAACQGFKDIQVGPCARSGGEAGTAAAGESDRLYAKIPAFRGPGQGPCSPSKEDIFRYAKEGLAFMGCVDSAPAGAAGAAGAAPTRSPADFVVKASELITKPTEQFVLMQHHMEAGSNFYYMKATKTTFAELAGGLKARSTVVFPGSRKTNTPGSRISAAAVSAVAAIDAGAIQAAIVEELAAAPAAAEADAAPAAAVADAAPAAAMADLEDVATSGKHHHRRSLLQMRDNRVQITNTQSWPYWNMGQLTFKSGTSGFLCSGTFMSPDDVITAGHCVVDSRTGTAYSSFRFAPGKNGGTEPYGSWGWRRVSWFSVWIGGGYTGSDGQTPAGSAYFDLAVVYTDRISAAWNGVGGYSCGSTTRALRSCGYPGDKGGSTMWCSDGNMFANDLCDGTADAFKSSNIFLAGGMSGGPVFNLNSNNPATAGVNSGGSPSMTVFAPVDVQTSSLYMSRASIWASTYAFRSSMGSIRYAANTQRCLDVNPITAGTRIQTWDCNNGANQNQWRRPAANSMELRFAGLCLAVANNNFSSGAAIIVTTCTNANNQWWFYDRESRLRPFLAPTMCLDAPNNNVANGVKMQLWTCNLTNAQKWVA